uniref:Vacuolar protein-sorting-associated protein 36 n=1 Tax=Globodera rostochiensis TaxID=31243 RepID=A0A914IAU1_GLORO
MDRLSWYQTGESMEEILCQAGSVGIYDGDLKQSSFEQGAVSLTYQRVIWADSTDPDCRLILHHSMVQKIEKQQKTMFGRGGKIIVTVKPVMGGHVPGPIAASGTNSLRFVFRNGGEEEFYKRFLDALNKQMWQRTSSSSSSASSSRNSAQQTQTFGGSAGGAVAPPRSVGILGIEKRLAEQHQRTHEHISEAFEDMSKLMEQAREMVVLSKNITERLRQKKGEITDDDDETVQLKSYLLSLGVSDPVTKSTFGGSSVFFDKLAAELTSVLLEPLKQSGGTMTLPEAFCRMNRARGMEMISPEDLLNACQRLDRMDSPISLFTFENGVSVLQLRSLSAIHVSDEVLQMVEAAGSMDASQLAKSSGVPLVLAAERLRYAEEQAKLCRDDTIEGLFFYPNKFMTFLSAGTEVSGTEVWALKCAALKFMPFRQDVWTHDSCLVCQSMHSAEEEKNKHELDESHKKKIVVYDFLSKEISCLTPSNQRSLLYERYYRANACVAGLDCICELNFSWSTDPLWACTICYVAGETLESADDHMHCSYHKRNYICEYHPDRYANLLKAQEKSAKNKQSLLEQEAIVDTLLESKGLLAPDVYVLNERSQEWAFQKLGLSNERPKAAYIAEDVTDNLKIALCFVCGETFFAFNHKFREAWFTHLSTSTHQRCKSMQILVHENNLIACEGVPAECELRTNAEFRRLHDTDVAGAHYGPTVGLEHLIIFNGNESFCSICYTILSNSAITDHFSSEYHIERFVRRADPGKLLNAQYLKVTDIHGILSFCYEERPIAVHKYFRTDANIPLLLRKYAFPEQRSLVTNALVQIDLGRDIKAIWCEECKEYINTSSDDDAWSFHIFDDSHFERAANRALYYYDEANVTGSAGILDDFVRSFPPSWDEQFSVSLGVLAIQNHCEFGLEFIIRDVLSSKLYCTCCFVQCDDSDMQTFSKHARSLQHITRAMHSMNKKIMITLNWRFPDINNRKPLLMDYLIHYHKNLRAQRQGVSVYNPALICKLNCSTALPRKLFKLAKIAPNDRFNFLATNKEDGTPEMVPLNVALREHCRIEVKLEEKEMVVFHCEECSQSFSGNFAKLDDAIEEHLLSLSHWERTKFLDDNPFDESQRVLDKESKIKVLPYKQPDPKKKVTWKWNDKKACYEFVYAQLGLEHIRERRHFRDEKPDIFCTLCAQSFKLAKLEFECHIRSFTHLFYFMHKHRPAIIPELQSQMTADLDLVEKHKNIRRLFARTLKGCESDKKQQGIRIYDFEQKDCEYADVKKALEEDKTENNSRSSDTRSKLLNQQRSLTIFDLDTVQIRDQKWHNCEALDKHFTDLVEKSMENGNEDRSGIITRSLEQAKRQLLGVVHFDGMVQLEDSSPSTSMTSVNGLQQQREQSKELTEKTGSASSKDTDALPDSSAGHSVTDDIPKSTSHLRTSERRRRSPSSHRRRRHHSRSPFQHRRFGRSPDDHRSKNLKSPSPKKSRRERTGSDLNTSSSRPTSARSRSKSAGRKPTRSESRSNTPPVTQESAAKRLHDLKMALIAKNMPRQFFPPPPPLKLMTQPGSSAGEFVTVPPPPPEPVPPAPSYINKNVGGVYDAGYLEEAFPEILRKAPSSKQSEDQTMAAQPEVAMNIQHSPDSLDHGEAASLGSQKGKSGEENKAEETDELLRNQLMNRLKKESRKDAFKKTVMKIPKDLPAFKQQALMRQHAEMLKTKSPSKKFGGRPPNVAALQEKQTESQQEDERLQAISPEPDDVVEVVEQQQQQQQQQSDERQNQTTKGSDSRWDQMSGKFVPVGPTLPQPNTQLLSGASSIPTTSSQQGMSIPKIGVISSPKLLAMSTSAVTAQRMFSGQQFLSNVPINLSSATATRPTTLLGQQHSVPSALFGNMSIPPNLLGTLNSALGVPITIPPPRFNQPPPIMGFPPPLQQHQPPVISPAEIIMRSKMQLYSRDLVSIDNIAAFIEYMWKQGYEPIQPGDPPLLLNEVLSKRKGLIGANTLYQIICFGHPELETYYCGMCNHWTTVSEMFNHLRASMHRLSYMFRNYKMYHRKAMEERDEDRRDSMLERFALKIWEIEGCGQCTNRMRCILNEEAIRRIWPNYINCVDNSWKIMDDDEELELSQPPLQQMDFSQQPSMVRATSTQVRASIVAKKLELAERAGHPGMGLVRISSDKCSEETENIENSKETHSPEKESDGSKSSNSSRSELKRNKLKVRSKHKNSGKPKRSRSRERSEKKKESERERVGRRRSRSKQKESKTDSKEKQKNQEGNETWTEKAAQFLHKIGDTKNATKMYWAVEETNVGPSSVDNDQRQKANTSGPTGAQAFSLAERLASSGQSLLRRRKQIDEREQQQVRRQMSPERLPATETSRTDRQRQQRPVVDDKTEMRKSIAVMIELQHEFEKNNSYLSAEMFFKTCQEFNITPDQVVNNGLLCETANELGVDLQRAELQALMQRNKQQPCSSSALFNLQSMGVDASKLRGLDPRALQSILSKADAVKTPSSSSTTKCSSSSKHSRFETHDISLNVSMAPGNFVYPSYEEGIMRQQTRRHGGADSGAEDTLAVTSSCGGGIKHYQQQLRPSQTRRCAPEEQLSQLKHHLCTSFGIPPDPKGAGGMLRTDSMEQPMDVDFTDDLDASWFGFSNDPTGTPSNSTQQAEVSSSTQQNIHQSSIASHLRSNVDWDRASSVLERTSLTPPTLQPMTHRQHQSGHLQVHQQQQQQQTKNPHRIAEEVGDDWNSLETFSFEMLGFDAGGAMAAQTQHKKISNSSASVAPPPPPP